MDGVSFGADGFRCKTVTPNGNRETKFATWMSRVDTYLEETIGVTTSDLPDMDYWTMFDHGISARDTAGWVSVDAKRLGY
jgi:hypothetical protein